MYKIQEYLTQLGLNHKEASTYLKLLELGDQPASIVAKKLGRPRSSTAIHLESLVQKGFAKKYEKKGASYYVPSQLDELKSMLNRKKTVIDGKIKELEKLSPEFKKLTSPFAALNSKVLLFEGIEGVCKMIDVTLEKDLPIYFISAHKLHPEITKYVREVYVPKRQKMQSKCQMIVSKHKASKDYAGFAKDVYEWIGFLDTKAPGLETTIAIQDNRILIHLCEGDEISGVLIENAQMANTMLTIFKFLKLICEARHHPR